jgi:hypothetical protein
MLQLARLAARDEWARRLVLLLTINAYSIVNDSFSPLFSVSPSHRRKWRPAILSLLSTHLSCSFYVFTAHCSFNSLAAKGTSTKVTERPLRFELGLQTHAASPLLIRKFRCLPSRIWVVQTHAGHPPFISKLWCFIQDPPNRIWLQGYKPTLGLPFLSVSSDAFIQDLLYQVAFERWVCQ